MDRSVLHERVIGLLEDKYKFARDAIIKFEVHEGIKSRRAVHELRDAIDHLEYALSKNISDDTIEKNLHACEEHLRRAAIEPVEYIAEKRLLKIERLRKGWLWWLRFAFVKSSWLKALDKRILDGVNLVEAGRKEKGRNVEISVRSMNKAFEIFSDILIELYPIDKRFKIVGTCLVIVLLVLIFT